MRSLPALAVVFASFLWLSFPAAPQSRQKKRAVPQPIIDMHVHAEPLSEFGGGELGVCTGDQELAFPGLDPRNPSPLAKMFECARPIKASATDEMVMTETFAEFEKYNVRRAVTAGPLDLVTRWNGAGKGRVIPALSFADRTPNAAEFRRLFNANHFKVFAEVGVQYRGLSPSDPTLEPYWALAEELDIPVGLHLGEGPPGGIHIMGPPAYRVKMGSPLLLEDLLVRHPKIRLYVMHYGSPFIDEMIAMLFSHPQVYVDISCNNWAMPRKQFYDHLRRLVEAGFGKRIMFGSDQMVWPKTIGMSIQSVMDAPFLTAKQKRDILYNNAARFLRLTEREIELDHSTPTRGKVTPHPRNQKSPAPVRAKPRREFRVLSLNRLVPSSRLKNNG